MIKACNAPMGSGKTTQITEKASVDMENGKSTLIFVPSHAAAWEVLERAKKRGKQNGCFVNLRGKSDEVCLPEHRVKQCKKCPVYKKAFGGKNPFQINGHDTAGQVFDTTRLTKLSEANGLCAMVVSRLLAMAESPRVIVATHAFLASTATFGIVEKIHVENILIDEGDVLFDTLLSNNQRELKVIQARQVKAHPVWGKCNEDCKGCVPHFTDQPGKGLGPRGGRVDDLPSVANKLNMLELLDAAIEKVQKATADGVVLDLFNFSNIKEMKDRLFQALPDYNPGMPTLEYLRKIEEQNTSQRVCLDERDDEGSDFVIPIDVLPVVQDSFDELSDQCEFPNIDSRLSSLRCRVLADPKSEAGKALVHYLETFLAFVDFLHCAPGQVYLIPLKHRIKVRSSGADHCSMSLRYLNTRHYRRVCVYLLAKTKLLSGTLFSADSIAANLLLERDQVSFKSIDPHFHKSALILVHTPQQTPSGQSLEQVIRCPQRMPPWAIAKLYLMVHEKVAELRVLHFSINIKKAAHLFRCLSKNPKFTQIFRVENKLKRTIEVDEASSLEKINDKRTSFLSIDKLRSSTSRAVNRAGFKLCTVFGNGVANWTDRILLFLEARKLQPDLTLGDFIAYEQKRAVTQALMRAPRDAQPTVCLYVGNLHAMAFPSFLINRIVTTDELVNIYRRDVEAPNSKSEALEYQLRALTHGIALFLKNGTIAIQRSRVEAGESILNKWGGRRSVGEKRLRHIDRCIEAKGFVDRVADRKGNRPEWTAFLDWAVTVNYIRPEQRGRKEVYVRFEA